VDPYSRRQFVVIGHASGVELIDEVVELTGRRLFLRRPPDPEALLDEQAFEHEEFLPYWAELWPSGVVLAERVARLPLQGKRVVELGCGLGLPSLTAAAGGADVLATDWAPDAVGLLRRNAARNGIAMRVEIVSWDEPEPLLAESPWDLVLAADVLYERRNADRLLQLLPCLGREALMADPFRPHARRFLEAAAADWRICTTVDPQRPRRAIHRLVRRA
jgi:predicted nicotinamide N-methyase